MDPHQASTPLSAADQARLNSFMLEIAGEACGHPKPDGSGNWRFGRSGALVIYSDGQFHDWSAGAHGHDALTLIQHCFPTADVVAWAQAFLISHLRMGDFVPHSEEQESEAIEDDTAKVAYISALQQGAGPIEGTAAHFYLTQTRKLPVPSETSAWLGFIPFFRGDEGALVTAYTDDAYNLCALGVTYITLNGQKSLHTPARQIFRGPRGWVRRALLRLGKPGPTVVETEGLEKGLAALATGAPYVVVTGGVSRFGLVELPTLVKRVIIARDDDPQGSAPDQAMWCGVLRRLGQGLEVGVTARPSESFGLREPQLKDLDDVFRHDPECASILLKGASLVHGRLGSPTENAILEKVSRLDAVALGRARKGVANLLSISVGALDDEMSHRVSARVAAREAGTKAGAPAEELTPTQ